jgi:hypothetical protein
MERLAAFREVWLADFEFCQPNGERPAPLCLVAREWRSGRLMRLWREDLAALAGPPFSIGPDALFVAYYASAELGCFLGLDWPMPARTLDLYAEFRRSTSGKPVPCGSGLLGALAYHGLDSIETAEKDSMRDLALRGGPYTAGERQALLDYCQSDVDGLARLLPAMLPTLDLPRALVRGAYMRTAAKMEWAGVPIDAKALDLLREHWDRIKGRLIETVNRDYGVFVPAEQRTLDPQSRLGAAILQEAAEWGIDPHRLADAVDYIWAEERQAGAEGIEARRAARRATGLTARRIDQLEDAGRDHTAVPDLDVMARDLAGRFPALGIGAGYDPDAPDVGYAGRLWEVLRERDDKPRPKHSPEILRRAAELVATNSADVEGYCGPMRFSAARWADCLARRGIPWPRLESGALDLSDDCFREMARAYPADVAPMRELRHALSQMRLQELAVGSDGRNRCLLSAFRSRTGRNQPSNTQFIFGPSTWLRSLIKPGPGRAVAYVDWEQQEFGIAAALSGDRAMMDAYRSGDPYLAFAKQARAIPANATKATHKAERERFKVLALAVQYGMGADALARQLDESPARGRQLLRLHRDTYPRYWEWSDAVEMTAFLSGELQAAFGWTVHVGPDANPRSLRNFPLQANGAEMLRLACCLATERGITVCAPVHDALLIEASAAEIDAAVADCQRAMQEASELVLPGFPLRTEAKIVRWPDRFLDPRGERFWRTVWGLIDGNTPSAGARGTLSAGARLTIAPALTPSPLISPSLSLTT